METSAGILAYAEAEGALLGQFRHLHTDLHGSRGFPFAPFVLCWRYGQDHHPS
ncbi:MAG: hypothetical protein ACOYMN_17595 [Roseimicrobium sp.]